MYGNGRDQQYGGPSREELTRNIDNLHDDVKRLRKDRDRADNDRLKAEKARDKMENELDLCKTRDGF